MATRAEQILVRVEEARDLIKASEEEVKRKNMKAVLAAEEIERTELEREKLEREKQIRLYWENWGVLPLFEELQALLTGSRLTIDQDYCILWFNDSETCDMGSTIDRTNYIEARVLEFDNVEREVMMGVLFWRRRKEAVQVLRQIPILMIGDKRVGEDGCLEELVEYALVHPKVNEHTVSDPPAYGDT